MKILKRTIFFSLGLILFSAGCRQKEEGSGDDSTYNRAELLVNYGTNLILPRYTDLEVKMTELQTRVIDFNESPTLITLDELGAALLQAQLSYQNCTSFEFGPAVNHTLRSVLSTYPTSESSIEANIANGNYDLFSIGNIAAKGFPAVGYLMYGNQKTEQEVLEMYTSNADSAQRKAYLLAVVAQSLQVVSQVKKEWVADGYQQTFQNSDGNAVGSSVSLMLNSTVLDFERFIRDGKVGIPLGVRSLGVANPEKVEAYYSKNSLMLVKQSITSFKNVFNGINENGTNGSGFDDYLSFEGASEVASNINIQLESVLNKLNALTGPLSEDVTNNKPLVQEVYDEMQKTIILLKVEMPSALSVLITYQDSDGD
ncbi:MAG: putative lipoprotein [Salibacteraceae bacterium]|jgi:predicted lipoprotein